MGGGGYLAKLKKRVLSLLVPYLIFTSLGAALLAIKGMIKQETSGLDTFLNDVIQGVITGTGNPPLWYLKSLFIFALFAPLLGYIVRWSKYSILLYPFTMMLCFHFGYSNILHWIPCLLVGCYLATYPILYKFSKKTNLWLAIAAVLYFVVFSIYFYNVEKRSGLVGGYIYRMSSMIPAAYLITRVKIFSGVLSEYLRPNTLFIYCSHYILILLTSPIAHLSPIWISYLVRVAIIIFTACMLAHFLRPTKAWKYINGGR